jgi:CHAT domain-containing protein/predicted negative regulator of RcsB-dependent stress response
MIITSSKTGFSLSVECCAKLLLTSLFLMLCVSSNQASPSTSNVSEHELTPVVSLPGEIAGGDFQDYTVQLVAGQYVRVLLAKQDLNLSVTLYGPDGQRLFEIQSKRYGPLYLSFVAETTGSYCLRARSMEAQANAGRYQLSVEAIRRASAQDAKEAVAYKTFYEAERSRAEWKEESLRESIQKYNDALIIWQSISRRREAIETLLNIGEVYFTLSDYGRALAAYQKALGLSFGDARAKNRVLNGIAYVLSYTGQDKKALGYFKEVVRTYDVTLSTGRSIGDRREEARALCGMGEIYSSEGNLQLALDLLQRALDRWIQVGDRNGQALAHLNSGHAYMDSGDAQKASEEFEQALMLWRMVGERRGEALSLTAIGGVHSLLGKKQLALEFHLQALNLFRSMGDHHGEAVALNGLARAYAELNELQTALDNYFQALRLYQENNSWEFESATEYAIGGVYRLLGDNSQARAHYMQTIVLSRKVNKRRLEAYALLDIAAMFSSADDPRQALNQYYQILKLYQGIGDRRGQASVLDKIGDIFYSSNRKQLALSYYKRALALNQSAKDLIEEATTLYYIARAERASGDLDEALSSIKSAIKIIEFLRIQIASPMLRSSYFASIRNHYSFYIDLLMQMHRERPGEGFAAAAFEASERARARALLELLTESKVNIRQGAAPELLERESFLQQQLNTKAQYRMRLLGSENKETQSEALEREIRQLTTEYEEVQARIREQSPRYAALTQPQPLRVEDIQAELKDGQTLLLEYMLGDEKSYLWIVSSTSVESYELPGRSTVEAVASEVYKQLTARPSVPGDQNDSERAAVTNSNWQYDEQILALSKMLIGPIAAHLGTKRLLIVPDGALQYIPFAALPVSSVPDDTEKQSTGMAQNGDNNLVPLILQHEVINLPSASTLAALRHETSSLQDGQGIVAVLADPVFEPDDPRVKVSGSPISDRSHAGQETSTLRTALRDNDGSGRTSLRLPFTRQEAEGIMAVTAPGRGFLATGFAADRATAMSARLSQYQIVHFATHGLIDSKRPELSGIVLSLVDEQGNPKDGFLQLHDIYNLRFSAKLVVLSACDTGLGKDVKGEGLVGLTHGFMYAGSKSVMASLWKVDDKATAELMSHFYRAMLKERLSPAAALKAAQVAMWKDPRWRTPHYWAAFILQGEYAESIEIGSDTQETNKPIVLLLVVGALAIGCFYALRRRKKDQRSIEGQP